MQYDFKLILNLLKKDEFFKEFNKKKITEKENSISLFASRITLWKKANEEA